METPPKVLIIGGGTYLGYYIMDCLESLQAHAAYTTRTNTGTLPGPRPPTLQISILHRSRHFTPTY